MKYKKKPVVIEAFEYVDIDTLFQWLYTIDAEREVNHNDDGTLTIKTLEGDHLAQLGDFIIQGVKGEIYPCKPDIFKMTYDKVQSKV